MPAHTKLSPTSPVTLKVEPEPLSPASTKEAQVASPRAYWGDRLTLFFWLFCFGLMFAMHLVEALHRLVLFLMGRFHGP